MKILKFGGSSVENPERIRNVINIILNSQKENKEIAVIFSAFGGVTDKLIETSALAAKGDERYKKLFSELEKRHLDTVNSLIAVEKQTKVLNHIKNLLKELEALILGVYLVKELSPKTLDAVVSIGEILSAYIISEYLKEKTDAEFLDARNLIKTDEGFNNAGIDFELSNKNIREYFEGKNNANGNNNRGRDKNANNNPIQCITGFIGATPSGQTTTLGRGGSDYTAAIFAAALDADEIEIWKDVDGVMTADPRKVKKAFSIASMTYKEAMELTHFGAKVIYPKTMAPAMQNNIALRIRNSFNPKFEGTVVSNAEVKNDYPIKGISSITDIALLRVEGPGMIGVSGISMRLFGALARKNISAILITQASSEHSICFAVEPKQASAAKKVLEEEFALEIKANLIDEVIVESELSILAIVGESMRKATGVSGKLFQALGKNGINVIAIAQGSSELNISVVINKADEVKALNVIHDAFFLSGARTVNLFLVGTGLIGSTLLKQIHVHSKFLNEHYSIDVKVVAIGNTKNMKFKEEGINLDDWKQELENASAMDISKFVKLMKLANLSNSVFVDCTASDEVVKHYEDILKSSISIVTPNKRASSSKLENYLKLKAAAQKHGVKFLYETNVGGGLPIISTLQDLFYSGDKILKIEAVLSGTLSCIFNNFKGEKKFSETVKKAKELGYTEPDPRDDLNGLDFARKLLILAREAGFMLELDDVSVENILPDACVKAKSVDEFFLELERNETFFEQKKKAAESKGKTLRFIGILENGKARISLVEVDNMHPFYSLSGADNIISFTTQRYLERPLVIRGPGAGAEVTAAGVFADVINTANYLV
ncbi:bifunctional aspartate kinase/homoserine dehydrogenase I [Candidatus Woesearchaeota archaeon]|nr:bifunctional aspartate kinase/homoserine dehydrogenase I [Candidatus Woesearchaeota archaeon]